MERKVRTLVGVVQVPQGAVQAALGMSRLLRRGPAPMIAIGCLALVVLPLLGLALGGFLGGPAGAKWGAGVGLVLALGLCGTTSYALVAAARRK